MSTRALTELLRLPVFIGVLAGQVWLTFFSTNTHLLVGWSVLYLGLAVEQVINRVIYAVEDLGIIEIGDNP